MIFRLPCTVTLSLDDSELRLVDIAPRAGGPPSAQGIGLAGVNTERAARKRADVDKAKPLLLNFLAKTPLIVSEVIKLSCGFSRNVLYQALNELRVSGDVVIDASGCCVVASKGGL